MVSTVAGARRERCELLEVARKVTYRRRAVTNWTHRLLRHRIRLQPGFRPPPSMHALPLVKTARRIVAALSIAAAVAAPRHLVAQDAGHDLLRGRVRGPDSLGI